MSVERLERALRDHGIEAVISAEGAVAVMRLHHDEARLADAAFRRALVAMAAEHGFRNLALELD